MKRMKKHELPVIPTANLVDIAILLIIFYMACSNFISQSGIKLTPPKAENLEQMEEPLILVTIDGDNSIKMQGRDVATAADVEAAISVLVKDKRDDQRNVMFKCDAAVSGDVFGPVLDAIVNGGGIIVAVGDNVTAAK